MARNVQISRFYAKANDPSHLSAVSGLALLKQFEKQVPCGIGTESRLQRLTQWFYVCDGEHQDDFTELPIPAQRLHGSVTLAAVTSSSR